MHEPLGRILRRAVLLSLLAAPAAAFAAASGASAGRLEILAITPAGADVPPGQEIVVQFDRAMVPLGRMGRPRGSLPVLAKIGHFDTLVWVVSLSSGAS